jgi:hypothetical protein
VERVADENDFYFVLTDEARDSFQVSAERCAAEGEEWLRCNAEKIGDGDADTAIADIQRKCARCEHD